MILECCQEAVAKQIRRFPKNRFSIRSYSALLYCIYMGTCPCIEQKYECFCIRIFEIFLLYWSNRHKCKPVFSSHATDWSFFMASSRCLFLTEKGSSINEEPWSGLRGSNSLPPPWQGGALPDELNPQLLFYYTQRKTACQDSFLHSHLSFFSVFCYNSLTA